MKIFLFVLCISCALPRVNAQIITTIAGSGPTGVSNGGYAGDGGTATNAILNVPIGLAIDKMGNIFIGQNVEPCIRKVNTAGIITTIAGTASPGFSGDGGPATAAQFYSIADLAIDKHGNILIVDNVNERIRKIDTNGIVSTIAGTGIAGNTGDGGAATLAQLQGPMGIATDTSGNIYIAEVSQVIRKINTAGTIYTIAGNGTAGFSGDGGPATLAQLNVIRGVAISPAGNIYIPDLNNNRIRMVNPTGIITTIAGTGTAGYSGDGGQATAAQFSAPGRIELDANGNIYVSEWHNAVIRKISTSGVITTITGKGPSMLGFSGDGGAATNAQIEMPERICFDKYGNLYFSDQWTQRIRKITYHVAGINEVTNVSGNISVQPNPARNSLFEVNIKSGSNEKAVITITNVTGEKIQELQAHTNEPVMVKIDAPGVYFIQATTAAGRWSERVMVE